MRAPGRTALRALLAAVSLALAAPGEARAQEPKKDPPSAAKADEASQRFKRGVGFYKDRDFPAALVEFKRAYELLPNYNVLYNLGQTARELKDHASALTWFEQYLREGGTKIQAPRRKEVQGAIDELKQRVGQLKITINVDGADVLIDDVSVGTAPLSGAVTANVGRRKISATASGYTPAQRVVDVAVMAETPVTLELTKVGATPPPTTQPDAKPAIPIYTWVTLSATGATTIAAGVMGGLALAARGSLKDELAAFPGDGKAITAAQTKTKTLAVATDVLGALTVAGAVATTLLFVIGPRTSEKPKPVTTGGHLPTVSVDVSPMGLGLHGSF